MEVRKNNAHIRKWINQVLSRDGYRCVICGTCRRGRYGISAHHIFHYNIFPDLREEINNGITLCATCHKYAHAKNSYLFINFDGTYLINYEHTAKTAKERISAIIGKELSMIEQMKNNGVDVDNYLIKQSNALWPTSYLEKRPSTKTILKYEVIKEDKLWQYPF